jgi:hypothetical protein
MSESMTELSAEEALETIGEILELPQLPRQTERRRVSRRVQAADHGPIIGGSPPWTSPQPPDLQGKFMATAISRDGKRKITAFQFPGAVVNSYSYLGITRNDMRHIRRRITLVPETQPDTQPDTQSVPSSVPSSIAPISIDRFHHTQTQAELDVEDGWRGRGLMNFSTEIRENWTEGHPKSTVTWMDTQTAEAAETARDDDQLPDLIQIGAEID